MEWLIYGAYGYTGELIAREAVRRGHRPVLAGRSAPRVQALAQALGLPWRAFDLDDHTQVSQQIAGHGLVLNCAGPFSATAAPMMEACLQARAHYLDITGEISIFELAQAWDARAVEAGIVLCPGVGFDVIPTDCVAAALKAALPDATHLALGFDTRSKLSAGTARTTLEGLAHGGKARQAGEIVEVPLAWRVRQIDFGDGPKTAMTIPWGDVATAFHTTGIANVEVYVPASPQRIRLLRLLRLLRPLLGRPGVQAYLKQRIDRSVRGPSEAEREATPTWVWGEARNARGESVTARLRTANGYSLTVTGSLAVVEHLGQHAGKRGAYTPAALVGADLVTRLPGSSALQLSPGAATA